MKNSKIKIISLMLIVSLILSFSLSGCVNQSQEQPKDSNTSNGEETIVATSVAIMNICEKMNIDLVGVPQSSISPIPDCYKDATVVGSPMAPDMEILAQVNPTWVLSPVTLMDDLRPKYEAAHLSYAFVNLKSIGGMYQSIKEMGELFSKQDEAQKLLDEYNEFMSTYKENQKDKTPPRVLLLMGLPGSYVVATKNSYAGSLLEMAGGINVYDDDVQEFLNVNTEDMLQKNPDIILCTAHALPDQVMEMFENEFKTNDIWKHFDAVKNGKVINLPPAYFGMSATFDYPEALKFLDEILY